MLHAVLHVCLISHVHVQSQVFILDMGEWMDCGDTLSAFAAFSGTDGSPGSSLALKNFLCVHLPAQCAHTHKYRHK